MIKKAFCQSVVMECVGWVGTLGLVCLLSIDAGSIWTCCGVGRVVLVVGACKKGLYFKTLVTNNVLPQVQWYVCRIKILILTHRSS